MKEDRKTVHRLFFAWDGIKEKNWLEKMALEGWEIETLELFTYTFVKREPGEIHYDFDFNVISGTKFEEYKLLFEEMGWKYINSIGSWHYFKSYPESNCSRELFNDSKSRNSKYKRVLVSVLLSICLMIPLQILLPFLSEKPAASTWVIFFIAFFMTIFLIYGVVRMILLLKKSGNPI